MVSSIPSSQYQNQVNPEASYLDGFDLDRSLEQDLNHAPEVSPNDFFLLPSEGTLSLDHSSVKNPSIPLDASLFHPFNPLRSSPPNFDSFFDLDDKEKNPPISPKELESPLSPKTFTSQLHSEFEISISKKHTQPSQNLFPTTPSTSPSRKINLKVQESPQTFTDEQNAKLENIFQVELGHRNFKWNQIAKKFQEILGPEKCKELGIPKDPIFLRKYLASLEYKWKNSSKISEAERVLVEIFNKGREERKKNSKFPSKRKSISIKAQVNPLSSPKNSLSPPLVTKPPKKIRKINTQESFRKIDIPNAKESQNLKEVHNFTIEQKAKLREIFQIKPGYFTLRWETIASKCKELLGVNQFKMMGIPTNPTSFREYIHQLRRKSSRRFSEREKFLVGVCNKALETRRCLPGIF